MDSLERLRGLHADLVAFNDARLANVDRLLHELEDSISEFRSLLDKTETSNADKELWKSNKVEVNGQEYGFDATFRELSFAVAKTLDVEEEEAGKLIIQSQSSDQADDEEVIIANVVSDYHHRRDVLLQNLRLTLQYSVNLDTPEPERQGFERIVHQVLDIKQGPISNASNFLRKGLAAMQKVEGNIFSVIRDIQSKELLSHVRTKAFYATLEFQRDMLFKQHEALGAIVAYLFRAPFTSPEDLRKMHDLIKDWQRLDMLWVHYLPAFSAAFRHYASPDGNVALQEAISLDKIFSPVSDTANPACRPLRAAIEMWWTAEHSAAWRDNAAKDPQLEKRTEAMRRSLNDGGLEFMLSACGTIKLDALRQPARHELVAMMLEGSTAVLESVGQTSSYFSLLLMEAYESFAEAWITNMPDSIRKLKSDEDDQRLAQITATEQSHLQASPRDQGIRLHLEAFLVLIAFAFEDRPDAAEQFWEDPDSNLYGFLQWASRRQTVPRVGAFCEMLCAISGSTEGAEAAHKFLLDDTAAIPNTKGRKLPSMSYGSIFFELEFYAKKVHERQPVSQVAKVRPGVQPEFNEMESPVMLSSYLRLLSHLSRRSSVVRHFILDDTHVDLPRGLLLLSSGPIPAYLRATVFTFLNAILVDKSLAVADRIWSTIDEWASTSHDKALSTNQQQQTQASSGTLQATLNSLASSPDQADAFVQLLCGLTAQFPDAVGQPIPFPPELGAAYRTPGIAPYVDFVCSQLTTKHVREWTEDTNGNGYLRCLHCVSFVLAVLEGFNESIATRSNNSAPPPVAAEYSLHYNQRHPFGRVMQWIFSPDLNQALLNMLHQPFESVADTLPDDPLLLNLRGCLGVIGATLDLQPTYFDVVKPKLKPIDGLKHINNAGLVAIEEVVMARPELVLDLCLYAASRHPQVSIQSLALLRRLAVSPRLQDNGLVKGQNEKKPSQMIDMLGPAGELQIQPVSGSLAEVCAIDLRELEAGEECDGYVLKEAILSFVNASLTTQSTRAQIVHLLLGFSRVGQRLGLGDQMEKAVSLLDAIVDIASGYPDGQDGVILSWLIHLKATAAGILRQLCTSPVSTELTLTQLRRLRYFTTQFSSQSLVNQTTLWDTLAILEPTFWMTTSADGFTEFLSFRASLYDYVSKELRYAFVNNILSLQQQYLTSLQGRSTDPAGAAINHVTVYDLFDFAELDIATSLDLPELTYFHTIDLESYRVEPGPNVPKLYNTDDLGLTLQQSSDQIRREAVQAGKPIEDNDPQEEAYYILSVVEARNKYILAQVARTEALRSYVNMICTILECCHMDDATKTQFALHMLQLILPKLDTYMADGAVETLELTRAADALLLALSSITTPTTQNRVDTNIAERLFQLFRICTEGVASSTSTPGLRLILYSVCAQYLARILPNNASGDKDVNERARRNAMDCIRSAGAQFITVLTEDAEEGLDSCRLNALHFIAQLVSLARSERSNIILEQLVKANTLEVLLEPIRDVAAEFQTTEPQNRSHLLTIFEARSMLLLQVSRTRPGAAALLDAGLIQTLRDSMIFTADPDLGLDLSETSTDTTLVLSRAPNTPSNRSTTVTTSAKSALHNYFILLSHLLRVLLSTFLSVGTQNEKIVYTLRVFLQEYRANMVGVFKKHAGVNGFVSSAETRRLLEECVRCYTGLCVGAGFVEDEDEQGLDFGGPGERSGFMGSLERRNGGFT